MKFVKISEKSQLPKNSKIKKYYNDKEILLVNLNDEYFALDNKCPHMGGSLADGELDGDSIICPRHGSVFDIRTGKVQAKGKLFLFSVKVNDLNIYKVKIDGEDIMIGID